LLIELFYTLFFEFKYNGNFVIELLFCIFSKAVLYSFLCFTYGSIAIILIYYSTNHKLCFMFKAEQCWYAAVYWLQLC